MVSFSKELTREDADAARAFVISRANESKKQSSAPKSK